MLEFMAAKGRPDSGDISMTKTLALVALALGIAGAPALAYADDACMTTAMGKKLAGAAKTSFMTKCERTGCESQAADKKLHGAAKNSFVKKCTKDAMTM
jgi:type IV secretory pathway TrbL component